MAKTQPPASWNQSSVSVTRENLAFYYDHLPVFLYSNNALGLINLELTADAMELRIDTQHWTSNNNKIKLGAAESSRNPGAI